MNFTNTDAIGDATAPILLNVANISGAIIGGNAFIQNAGALAFAADFHAVGKSLSLVAGGDITQTSVGTIIAQGAVFNASGNNVELESANNFGTIQFSSVNDATITDSGDIVFAASTLTGGLTVDAGGNVTQTGALVVPGTTTVTDAANIDLATNGGSNDFTGAVSLANSGAFDVAITDANALTLGTLSIPSRNLTVISTGALNLGAGTVGGNLSATSNGGAINMTEAGPLNVGGDMSLNSNGGAISQTGVLTVTGTSSITAGAAAINLDNTGNNFGGVVSLSNTGANSVALFDSTSLSIIDLSSAGAVTITAGTALDFNTTSNYNNLTGTLMATAGTTITLNDSMSALGVGTSAFNAGTTFTLTGELSITAAGAGNVILQADAIALGSAVTAVTANGGITLRPATSSSGLAINDGAVGFSVTTAQLLQLASTGTVTLGSTSGSGAINIGSLGAVNLTSKSYSLAFANSSGGMNFNFPSSSTFAGLCKVITKYPSLNRFNSCQIVGFLNLGLCFNKVSIIVLPTQ